MKRATTPTHTFTLPDNASTYQDIHITYAQRGEKVLEKNKANLTIDGKVVSFTMTQAEANLFAPREAEVQVRVRLTDGNVFASQIIPFNVNAVLCDEILPIQQENTNE